MPNATLTESIKKLPIFVIKEIFGFFGYIIRTNEQLRIALSLYKADKEHCIAKYGDPSTWYTGFVTDVSELFKDCTDIPDIRNWDVSNVTNMAYMFYGAVVFNQDIGKWNVGKVTNMTRMFRGAVVFNQDIGNWDVSNVTKMHSMFSGTDAFNQDIGKWNVGKVTRMSCMFYGAVVFNQDIGKWNVGKVTDMSDMFNNAHAFN